MGKSKIGKIKVIITKDKNYDHERCTINEIHVSNKTGNILACGKFKVNSFGATTDDFSGFCRTLAKKLLNMNVEQVGNLLLDAIEIEESKLELSNQKQPPKDEKLPTKVKSYLKEELYAQLDLISPSIFKQEEKIPSFLYFNIHSTKDNRVLKLGISKTKDEKIEFSVNGLCLIISTSPYWKSFYSRIKAHNNLLREIIDSLKSSVTSSSF